MSNPEKVINEAHAEPFELGFLFFGTIAQVEEAVRNLVEPSNWLRHPVRFVVIDISLVGGMDMSAAEAFVRTHRVLSSRNITMVLCGFSAESAIGKSLQNVGLFEEDYVELFSTFNDAMECKHCNFCLKSFT